MLLEEGLSARGEKELLDSRHLSLFGVLHACPCSRRVGSTLGGVDAARWGKPSFSARENFILLGVLHASSYRSVPTLEKLSFLAREDSVLLSVLHARLYRNVRALGPGVRLRSARGETELLGSRRLTLSKLGTACLSDSCCTRVLLGGGAGLLDPRKLTCHTGHRAQVTPPDGASLHTYSRRD